MTWAAPVVILDLDDTVIDDTGGAEVCWRGVCDEAAGTLRVDGTQLDATPITQRLAFRAVPELNRLGRHEPGASKRIVGTRTLEATMAATATIETQGRSATL
jgi:hypothetical protein